VAEGYSQFEFVPAVIKGQIDADTEDAMLIMMNSTQRNKTDWEKVMEHMKLKEIIPKLKKRQGLDGRTRDIEADMLGVSRGQISIYNTIGTRLDAELMKLFKDGGIGISLAHEAAQLGPELQQKLVDVMLDKGSFTEEDIRLLVSSRPMDGQMKLKMEADENVPDSGTFEEIHNKQASVPTAVIENAQNSEEQQIVGKELIPPTDNEPMTKEKCETEYDISCETVTSEMQNKSINDTVSDSGTSESDGMKENKLPDIDFRGGYTLAMIEKQIEKYDIYLNLAVEEGDRPHIVSEYNCLLDALDLLRIRLTMENENEDFEDGS
nr:hypothetical protein [Lachnospiraceae bacterium]